MSFDAAQKVADAVLFEGYLLYPYRASSQKNQLRWQFGVLMPPGYPDEPCSAQTECLVEPGLNPTLAVRLRFLQVIPCAALDEGLAREIDFNLSLVSHEQEFPFAFDDAVRGVLRIAAQRLEGAYGVLKLRVKVANTSAWQSETPAREDALHHAMVATHILLALSDGAFISMLDPPEWAKPAVQACVNERTFPVLVGEPGQYDLMLSAPIILYDYPQIAPESPGDLFDATEIDEILTLRTMALSDAEKREARETDPRAAALVDRVETLPGELLERLHGALRYVRRASSTRGEGSGGELSGSERPSVPWWDPGADASVSPDSDALLVRGQSVSKGSRVKLTPGARRADAHDMFLAGRTAMVEGVFLDVDGERYLAVTLVDDPGADLYAAHGRYLYFRPDEVEPL